MALRYRTLNRPINEPWKLFTALVC